MFCPNCGKENSTEQKFCRACGIGLEKIVESLMEQKPLAAQDAVSLRKQILLETFGTVAFGGFLTVVIIAVGAIIYTIITKFVLTGANIWFGILLTAFFVFGILTVIYIILAEDLKEKKQKRQLPGANEIGEPNITANLLADNPFEPIPSVTENSTELLYTKNKTQKLQ